MQSATQSQPQACWSPEHMCQHVCRIGLPVAAGVSAAVVALPPGWPAEAAGVPGAGGMSLAGAAAAPLFLRPNQPRFF